MLQQQTQPQQSPTQQSQAQTQQEDPQQEQQAGPLMPVCSTSQPSLTHVMLLQQMLGECTLIRSMRWPCCVIAPAARGAHRLGAPVRCLLKGGRLQGWSEAGPTV
jgi:hypothetical protein